MERLLKGLNPERVFYYFEEITKIPRGSGNEKQVSDYLFNLAKSKNWDVVQDDYLNIIIKKPASKGYENAPVVMLQGHMDMVCEKNENVEHDFEKDPIKLRIIDGNIYATETTLGADNGIALAYALAILDSDDLAHPPLEVLFTIDEEKGMTGVEKVDGSIFKSRYLLNLDSEEEGVFTCGCAGGGETIFKIPVKVQEIEKSAYKLSVKGLLGGHSGMEIHKERGNANKILGRVLYGLFDQIDLVSIGGGSKGNAIPREAHAVITTDNIEDVKRMLVEWNEILKNEYSFTDPSVNIEMVDLNCKMHPLDRSVFKKVVSAINMIPTGVLTRSTAIDLVISSNNLGIVAQDEQFITLFNMARSSVNTLMTHNIFFVMKQIGDALNIECSRGGFYPGWEYAKESKIRDICIETYKEMYGKEPIFGAIHAGVECGLLMGKVKGLDAISMGPSIYDAHSPNEHMNIESVGNVYNLLCKILESIK